MGNCKYFCGWSSGQTRRGKQGLWYIREGEVTWAEEDEGLGLERWPRTQPDTSGGRGLTDLDSRP